MALFASQLKQEIKSEAVSEILDNFDALGAAVYKMSLADALATVDVGGYFVLLAGAEENASGQDQRYLRTLAAPGYVLTADQPATRNSVDAALAGNAEAVADAAAEVVATAQAAAGQSEAAKDETIAVKDQALAALIASGKYGDPANPTVPPSGVADGQNYLIKVGTDRVQVYLNTGVVGAPVSGLTYPLAAAVDNVLSKITSAPDISGYGLVLKTETGGFLGAFDNDGKLHPLSRPGYDMGTGKTAIEESPHYDVTAIEGIAFVQRAGPSGPAQPTDKIISYTLIDGTQFDPNTTLSTGATASSGGTVTVDVPTPYNTAIKGAMYNHWVHPFACRMGNRLYVGGVGNGLPEAEVWGPIFAVTRDGYDAFKARAIFNMRTSTNVTSDGADRTDDHNGNMTLCDPRPNAPFKTAIMQAEHGGYPVRWAKSVSGDIEDYGPAENWPGGGSHSYIMAYRNPVAADEIVGWNRDGGSTDARWYVLRSLDNGTTKTAKKIITKNPLAGGDSYDLYMLVKPSRNGLGLHIGIQNRPQKPPNADVSQRILYFYYEFATGALKLPWNAIPYVANIYDAGFTGADPFYDAVNGTGTRPKVIYEPVGTIQKRLFDLCETADGKVGFVFADCDVNAYGTGYLKYAELDTTTGNVTGPFNVKFGGFPLNNDVTTNSYLAGGCLVGHRKIAAASWNASDTPKAGFMGIYDGGADGSTWTLTKTLVAQDEELSRPYCAIDWRWDAANSRITWSLARDLLYCRGGYYETFKDWDMDLRYLQLPKGTNS